MTTTRSKLLFLSASTAAVLILAVGCGSSDSATKSNGDLAVATTAPSALKTESTEPPTTTAVDPESIETPCHITGEVTGEVELQIDNKGLVREPANSDIVVQNFEWKTDNYTFYLTHNADYPHVHGGFIEDGDDFKTGGLGITYQPATLGADGGTAEGEYFSDPTADEFAGTFAFTIECGE